MIIGYQTTEYALDEAKWAQYRLFFNIIDNSALFVPTELCHETLTKLDNKYITEKIVIVNLI